MTRSRTVHRRRELESGFEVARNNESPALGVIAEGIEGHRDDVIPAKVSITEIDGSLARVDRVAAVDLSRGLDRSSLFSGGGLGLHRSDPVRSRERLLAAVRDDDIRNAHVRWYDEVNDTRREVRGALSGERPIPVDEGCHESSISHEFDLRLVDRYIDRRACRHRQRGGEYHEPGGETDQRGSRGHHVLLLQLQSVRARNALLLFVRMFAWPLSDRLKRPGLQTQTGPRRRR